MTPEQIALLAKAELSLKAAHNLARDGFPDFSASRAYYTMFYLAEALLLGDGLSFSKHAGVIAAFGQHFVKPGRLPEHLHRYLIEGMERRNLGDYAMGPGLSPEAAAEQLRWAEEFMTTTRGLLEKIS